MKKCLCCDNEIEKINHYVCSDCYKRIKEIKMEFIELPSKKLESEYSRWLRNKNMSRDPKYKNEYQLKVIAIAELFKEKYNDDKKIKAVIDFSNKQEIDEETTKRNEEVEEEIFNEENKDKDVNLKDYKTYLKCDDGHRVSSKSEKIIDDFLTKKGIRHYYDLVIDDDTNWRYDFYLPDYDIFIEHWGYKTKNYSERKRVKLAYYNSKGYKLVESEEETIGDTNNLRKALKQVCPDIFKK